MRDPELRAAMARDTEELWEELGARFGNEFEDAGPRPPLAGVASVARRTHQAVGFGRPGYQPTITSG
jgi:hypothetical protein